MSSHLPSRKSKTETHATLRAHQPPKIYPSSLADLLEGARKKQESGDSQWDILRWVYEVADHFGIRIRSEERIEMAMPPSLTVVAAADTALLPSAAGSDDPKRASEDGPVEPSSPSQTNLGEKKGSTVEPDRSAATVKRKDKPRSVPVILHKARDGRTFMVLEQLLDPEFDPRDKLPSGAQKEPRAGEITRLILSCDRHNVKASVMLCAECNGAVIDARTWMPLAIPPRAFNPRHNAHIIDEWLSRSMFDIIPIPDGTVVTLYPWDPSSGSPDSASRAGYWGIATCNGYDVSTLKWMGPLAYAEVFRRGVEQYPVFVSSVGLKLVDDQGGQGPFLFCADLDRTKCYTIGFRHHDFHPMKWDPMRMWQIQYTIIAGGAPTLQVIYSNDGGGLPGIPWQETVTPESLAAMIPAESSSASSACSDPKVAQLEAQLARLVSKIENGSSRAEEKPAPRLTLEKIQKLCSAAIEDAKKIAATKVVPGSTLGPPRPNYGFILRSRDPRTTGEYSDFLIESPLLRKVRKILYQRPSRSIREDLNFEVRLEYNIIRTYLTAMERDDCIALFPDWKAKFNAYEEFIKNVVHSIIHMGRQVAMGAASREPVAKSATTAIAKALLEHITRHESLTAFHQDTESIIRDYVTNPEYALVYMRAMRNRPAP
jgi:hypothetical protein